MSRRGYSLIEMVAVITVGSVVMGIGVGMLHVLLRVERTGRERVHQARVSAQLAEQFRRDAEAAVRQDIPPTGDYRFDLMDGRVVTYRVGLPEDGIEREERAAGKLVRRESYTLPEGWRFSFAAVTGEAAPSQAYLMILNDDACPTAGRVISIIAVLGKDHRFTKSPVGSR